MHDLDRTQVEMPWETSDYGPAEFGYEAEGGYEGEFGGESETEGPLSEAEEMELASELLEVSDEEELDQFLGDLVRKVSRSAGKLIKGPLGKAVGGVLKGVAKQALPMAGAALGSVIPVAGTAIGGALGSAAGQMLGLELEGLSPEDQEFETARQFVRFAGEVAQQAASAPANMPPQAVAQKAATTAAQKYAPGLLNGGQRAGQQQRAGQAAGSGRWYRHGDTIVLTGVFPGRLA
jgi:hypothetical protein